MTSPERIRLMLDAVTTAAITLACGVVVWLAFSSGSPRSMVIQARQPGESVVGLETTVTDTARGQAAARLAVVEFADFQCPFCGRSAQEIYPELQRDFIDSGQVEYVYRHFPLESIHSFAFKASEAAECAGQQGRYWDMHRRLFEHQDALAGPSLLEHARALGLARDTFTRCLDGGMAAKIKADQAEGNRLGVQSTPTFFIGTLGSNGKIKLVKKIPDAVAYSTLKAELQKLL